MNTICVNQVHGRRRRRQCRAQFKRDVVAACTAPGVSMAAVAIGQWPERQLAAPLGQRAGGCTSDPYAYLKAVLPSCLRPCPAIGRLTGQFPGIGLPASTGAAFEACEHCYPQSGPQKMRTRRPETVSSPTRLALGLRRNVVSGDTSPSVHGRTRPGHSPAPASAARAPARVAQHRRHGARA